tara:strand:+ start:126 stop:407 length:282 start_codon:yes stop_codon:yes gene_type:complete
MSTFVPFNRHILVRRQPTEEQETGILLPDDYNNTRNTHEVVTVIGASPNCAFIDRVPPDTQIVVLSNFLEEISVGNETHTVILENYVLGAVNS